MVGGQDLEKVLVVGAGLGGLLTSHVLLKGGFNVELIEEHDSVGLPRHCSGLVSDYVVEFLGRLAREHVMRKFTEYSVKMVEGDSIREVLTISFRKPVYLLDRVRLEKTLCEVVSSLGGRVSTRTLVTSVDLSKNSLKTNREPRYYDLVVISEGATRRLVKSLNLCSVSKYLFGPQAFLSVNDALETTEVIVSPLIDPEGFGWVIPVDEKHVISGLVTTSRRAGLLLKYLIKKVFRSSSYEVKNFFGGLIPADKPCEKIIGENYFLVGDAASTMKPISKGGIYPLIEEVAILRDSLSKGSLNRDLIAGKYKKLLNFLKAQHLTHRAILGVGGYYRLVKSLSESGLKEFKILDYDKLVPDPVTPVFISLAKR